MIPCNLHGQFVFNSDNNDVLTFCPKKRAFSESTEIPAPGPDLSAPFFAAGWTKKGNINWKNWIISWEQRWSSDECICLPSSFKSWCWHHIWDLKVCCWLSPLLHEVLLWLLRFSPLLGRQRTAKWMCYFYNSFIEQRTEFLGVYQWCLASLEPNNLRRNLPGNWVILILSGQKPWTRII